MGWIKRLNLISFILLIALVLTSCTAAQKGKEANGCMEVIDWVDFLMINDIRYHHNYEGSKEVAAKQIGDKLGEVSYMLAGNACTDHMSKNGDASYLPIGTNIYELEGYKPEFRVVADNKIYEVSHNPRAKTLGSLLDVEDKVTKVSLQSGYDGNQIGYFSQQASSEFVRELLPLKYVGFDAVYNEIKHESGIFLRIYLKDDTSFRMVYYPKANAFSIGALGNERLNELIMDQRKQIKSAAEI